MRVEYVAGTPGALTLLIDRLIDNGVAGLLDGRTVWVSHEEAVISGSLAARVYVLCRRTFSHDAPILGRCAAGHADDLGRHSIEKIISIYAQMPSHRRVWEPLPSKVARTMWSNGMQSTCLACHDALYERWSSGNARSLHRASVC